MKRRRFFTFCKYAIPVFLVAIALQYTIITVLSVRAKMKSLNDQVDARLLMIDSGQLDPAYMELYRKKLWLETRYQIARTDEISLSVNLKDSLLQLELKGVVIKVSRMVDYETDQFFKQLNTGAYYHLFASQAQVDTCFSTILREPFVIKQAPKDTSAVESRISTIDSSKVEAVHWMMKLNNGVVVKIEGTDKNTRTDWWIGQHFWLRHDLKAVRHGLAQTIRFRIPEYYPEIRLVIPEADAKAIYRALPEHHLVCIRL